MGIVSPEALIAVKQHLADSSKYWTRGLCQGDVCDMDGERRSLGHTACHSWIQEAFSRFCPDFAAPYGSFTPERDYLPSDQNFLVFNCHTLKRSGASPEATTAVIRWIATESPFAKHILNGDDSESLANGVVFICGPGGLFLTEAVWMCKFMRYAQESSSSLNAWYELYNNGVDPFFAAYIASIVTYTKGASFGAYKATAHASVFFNNSPDLDKLIKHKYDPEASTTSNFFGETSDNTVEKKIKQFCKPVQVSDGWGGFIDSHASTKEEFITNVKEFEKSLREPAKREKVIFA